MLTKLKKASPDHWQRGNPQWRWTWTSPKVRINWFRHQRWIMSVMQWGITMSEHGSLANPQASAHMVWGLNKGRETLLRQVITVHQSWRRGRNAGTNECIAKWVLNSLHIETIDKTISVGVELVSINSLIFKTLLQERKEKLLAGSRIEK